MDLVYTGIKFAWLVFPMESFAIAQTTTKMLLCPVSVSSLGTQSCFTFTWVCFRIGIVLRICVHCSPYSAVVIREPTALCQGDGAVSSAASPDCSDVIREEFGLRTFPV